MTIAGLSQAQGFTLLAEITSARNLLAYGIRTIRTAPFVDTTLDPILTLTSIGFEKLYKLTLGVTQLGQGNPWPSKTAMQTYGHGVEELHRKVFTDIRPLASTNSFTQPLIDAVDTNPVTIPFIATLDRYGRQGRFYNLDELAASTQAEPAPFDLWTDTENTTHQDPTIRHLYSISMANPGDDTAWDRYHQAVKHKVATTAETICAAIAMAGVQRLYGEPGRTFGTEIRLDMVGQQTR